MIADVIDHWPVYVSMPLMAALIGYLTKLVAVEMLFRPMTFVGIPPWLGWQGIVPRHAERITGSAVTLMTERLLDPTEVIATIDMERLVAALREPVERLVDDVAREVLMTLDPEAWQELSPAERDTLLRSVQAMAPLVGSRVLSSIGTDFARLVDLPTLATDALLADKSTLVRLIRTIGRKELGFIVRVGIPMGFVLGIVQAATWALTKSTWIVPVFGAFTGLITDYLALQMIFRPVTRRGVSVLGWQGLFHRNRPDVVASYSRMVADDIVTPSNVLESLLAGPFATELSHTIEGEVRRVITETDAPVTAFVSSEPAQLRSSTLKPDLTRSVVAHVRGRMKTADDGVNEFADVQGLIATKMADMTDDEYEGLLRPAFKQDEWKIVVVGAVLGFLVGELQVHLLLG